MPYSRAELCISKWQILYDQIMLSAGNKEGANFQVYTDNIDWR